MKRKFKQLSDSDERRSGEAHRDATESSQEPEYEVGYRKPPKHTRFVKGQSGNPRGRPRKPKPRPLQLSDAPSDRFLEEEAYRPIALRENGQAIELPAVKAVMRALTTSAIKGNRLAQKYLLEHVRGMEEVHLQRKIDNYVRLRAVKRDGEQVLAAHKRKALAPPELLPHPDDIILNAATGDAHINGPATPEDLREYEHTMQLRDHLMLRSVHVNDRRRKTSVTSESEGACIYQVLAILIDQALLKRFRWQEGTDLDLLMECHGLSRRERQKRITEEFEQLKSTRTQPLWITPEIKWEIDQIAYKWSKRREDSISAESTEKKGNS